MILLATDVATSSTIVGSVCVGLSGTCLGRLIVGTMTLITRASTLSSRRPLESSLPPFRSRIQLYLRVFCNFTEKVLHLSKVIYFSFCDKFRVSVS